MAITLIRKIPGRKAGSNCQGRAGSGGYPLSTEGGTYAQVLPNAIPYGATVPDRVRLFGMVKGGAHQADEYCDIPNLLINMQIYVRALIELDEMYSK